MCISSWYDYTNFYLVHGYWKFFTLRATSPAHPGSALASKCSKIAPTWHQHGAKMRPRWGQDGETFEKDANTTKRWVAKICVPILWPKKWPTWPQLASQHGAKMANESTQESIIVLMPLGIDFWMDFNGFWIPTSWHPFLKRFWLIFGAMLGSKIEQKSIKNGIEKTIEKRRPARWPTRRSKRRRG